VIFVDSSFWIAQAIPRDRLHAAAIRLGDSYAEDALMTSNLVCGETWTYLRRKTGYKFAIEWLDVARSHQLSVERIDRELESEAWRWLHVHDERPYSFVDATSFALMRKLRIEDALAFDGDFGAAGFVELRP
jgi:predicted nucleic acid-binding protein